MNGAELAAILNAAIPDAGREFEGSGEESGGGMDGESSLQGDDKMAQKIAYSMPGVLHFLQTQWATFETERAQFEMERAELQARILFLEGERQGQENLKRDLVRRIKMLEYALKQERAKNHQLKYGGEMPLDTENDPFELVDSEKDEIDKLLSSKLDPNDQKGQIYKQGRQLLRKYLSEIGYADTLIDTRDSRVRAMLGVEPLRPNQNQNRNTHVNGEVSKKPLVDAELKDFEKEVSNFLEDGMDDEISDTMESFDQMLNENHSSAAAFSKSYEDDDIDMFTAESDGAFALGVEGGNMRDSLTVKFVLKNHFDAVRSVLFHPTEMALITASEDHTLKLWNLERSALSPAKKSAPPDMDPLYTFRGHSTPVLTSTFNSAGDMCFSAGLCGNIFCWNMPLFDDDPWGPYSSSILGSKLSGHTNAVWSLSAHSLHPLLLSASADSSVKLWNTETFALQNTFMSDKGVPTAVQFVKSEHGQALFAYSSSVLRLFDVNSSQQISKFELGAPENVVNAVCTHPTLPLTVVACEDKTIRVVDHQSATTARTMTAAASVTSLDISADGCYLLSGSHDGSIRLWDLETFNLLHDVRAHQTKNDEGVHSVAFHPKKPYVATGGADAVVKVYM